VEKEVNAEFQEFDSGLVHMYNGSPNQTPIIKAMKR